jgi:glucose-6-phosphate isomerase
MSWTRFEESRLGISVDLRFMALPDDLLKRSSSQIHSALGDMEALEAGALANVDEGRMVGHYWLRAPELAPSVEVSQEIQQVLRDVSESASRLQGRFNNLLVIGIGGSCLGTQLLASAVGQSAPRAFYVLDNTDPVGIADILAKLRLDDTLVLVVSKSGRTIETSNAMKLVRHQFEEAGCTFPAQAIAISQPDSELAEEARRDGWLASLPLWSWVGGRTSITSAVGLLPAHLLGIDVDAFLGGARQMDQCTRSVDPSENPALLLALAWQHHEKTYRRHTMVVLPYRDRLQLLGRYLQQLLMESLGKRQSQNGCAGLTVYGNKGTTDQHSFLQQLVEGPDVQHVHFVEVLDDGSNPLASLEMAPGVTAGDHLSGFLGGTRNALSQVGRPSTTVTLECLDARSMGALVAMYERAVGFAASFAGINAYHQPGVEAGKRAANALIQLQHALLVEIEKGSTGDARFLAAKLAVSEEDVFHVLRHLEANGRIQSEGKGLHRRFYR